METYEELIAASNDNDSNIKINDSATFKNRVIEFSGWVNEADIITA